MTVKMKLALEVKSVTTLEKLNFLIELVYNTKRGCNKQFVQNQFEKNFGKELPNRNFYRYFKRVSFLSVEKSWVYIHPSHQEEADQYVCEYLPELFYRIHPRYAA